MQRRIVSGLSRTVLVLGFVSLLTDLSSEMIYPLLPLFLTSVLGAGAAALGLIEGIAESTAAVLKVVSGIWADRSRRRKPLIVAGYCLAGAARPLIGLASGWTAVLILRFVDRSGKGLRGSPRDALIADVTDVSLRGRAYGLLRAMDHAGAVMGPLAAAALLAIPGFTLRRVFLLAGVPAVMVILVLLMGVEEPERSIHRESRPRFFKGHWQELGRDFGWLVGAVLVFTLGNSSDAFLLMSLSQAGVPAAWIAVLWSLHHVIKMASCYVGGAVADAVGFRRLVTAGWILYAAIYLGFGLARSGPALIALFLAYGLYFGLTEPVEKAWVSRIVPETWRGTAFGYYNGAIGLGALPASLLFGVLWQVCGRGTAFVTGSALALLAAVLLRKIP